MLRLVQGLPHLQRLQPLQLLQVTAMFSARSVSRGILVSFTIENVFTKDRLSLANHGADVVLPHRTSGFGVAHRIGARCYLHYVSIIFHHKQILSLFLATMLVFVKFVPSLSESALFAKVPLKTYPKYLLRSVPQLLSSTLPTNTTILVLL